MTSITTTPADIIQFWYSEPMNKHWFASTRTIDALIRERFESLWQQAACGELNSWLNTPEGCLALCIVLDQFPLNMYRNQPLSFSTEQQAIRVCKQAIAQNFHQQLPKSRLAFLFMPLMHSENLDDQALSIKMFDEAGLTDNAKFARHHQNIVKRFGRFPHRNAILGRDSTQEEMDWLNSDDAFKG